MLRTTRPTTQHHYSADWNTFYTRCLLAENIQIPCVGYDSVQLDRRACLMGRNHPHLHGQPWYTPLQTITHVIPTILPVLFNTLFLLWYLYVCLRCHNTCMVFLVSAHSTEILLLSKHVPVYFLHLFKLHSFTAKCVHCQHTIYISI